ncbi:MAG TPA: tryptophan--tRNA ligase, partial [Candidatus Hydrogenedentes bacterium]|nr:tryptophan--tRNA ligase [Candidatus Hydrogenedentota bacterium]
LYDTKLVPVGDDQKQHLELTRDLASRFNARYGDVFTIPEPFVPDVGGRIMSLQEPLKKMSKSDTDPNNYIALLDDADTVRRKIKRAVTDSGCSAAYDESRPGIANLVVILSCVTGESYGAIEERFAGKGYRRFKQELADAVTAFLKPLQKRYRAIRGDEKAMETMLRHGAEQARDRARPMLENIHNVLGFIPEI